MTSFLQPAELFKTISVPKNGVAVDFGCGNGYIAIILAKQVVNTGTVYAIDINSERVDYTIREAKEKGVSNIRGIVSDILEGVPLANECADLVCISSVLHQVEDMECILREAWRIAKPGASIVVIDWDKDKEHVPTLLKTVTPHKENVSQFFKVIGCTKCNVSDAGDCHYMMHIEK